MISVSIKSNIANALQTNSANFFEGANNPPRKRVLKYESLLISVSPSFNNDM